MNAAAPVGSNLDFHWEDLIPREDLRLEHELQTAVGRQRLAPPQSLSIADGSARYHGSTALAADTHFTPEAPVVLFLKGIGVAYLPHRLRASAPERFESGIRLAPVIMVGETIAADLPDALNATQPEPVTVNTPY
jgi:hypothetical protein